MLINENGKSNAKENQHGNTSQYDPRRPYNVLTANSVIRNSVEHFPKPENALQMIDAESFRDAPIERNETYSDLVNRYLDSSTS
jgi:hypothetical protein